ncbi:MAG: RagB/SusD family nutrient uptake outer membrane protein [Eubacteriales bacterium]|nr:RagB/SusD family nutrient uptake outer membrane protein [Eubacteriales bacterium]
MNNMRNNIITYCLGLVSIFALNGCQDFLKESSQDEIIPSTVSDLRSVMYKEAYPYAFSCDNYVPLLTDEMTCNGLNYNSYAASLQNGTPVFTFNPEMFDGIEAFPLNENSWKKYYEKIKGCNVIISQLANVSGTEKEKNALLGQSLCLRGYYYMKLVLLYGQAYTGEGVNPEESLGVPLILSMDVTDQFPSRNTLKEVYDQIESDLTRSAELLDENYISETAFRVGHITANALLSRFYLYKGDFEKLIQCADKVVLEGPALTNLASLGTTYTIFDPAGSSEVLWVYGSSLSRNGSYFTNSYWNATGPIPFTVSTDLIDMYDSENDLRYSSYFYYETIKGMRYAIRGNKIGQNISNYGERGVRMGEVYINRAEAAARLFKENGDAQYKTQALSDLNTLRRSRYKAGTYTDVDISDSDELISFCLTERQRELCLEESLRWYDIKRLGIKVTHRYVNQEGDDSTHELVAGSKLYALPIPYDAINRNYKLVQNPR